MPCSRCKTWLPVLLVAFVLMGPCLAEKKDNSLDWKWHKGRATYYASWNTWLQPRNDAKESGMRKGQALCANIKNQGALALKTNTGAFQNKYKLEFWVYVGVGGWEGTSATVPDIKISLRGTKGQCSVLKFYDVKPDAFEPTCNYCADYYWRFTFYLPYFSGEWSHKTFNNPNQFGGCGGNTVWDINQIEFRNYWGVDKWVCLDKIALV